MPPLEANVQETVAVALAGSVLPEVFAVDELDAVAVAAADAVAEEAELAAVVAGSDVEVAPEAHPTTPTIAAADSPPRKALRVTVE